MPAEKFIDMISDKSVLSNPLLPAQHFIGGTRYEKISDDKVVGYHQLRIPHQIYKDARLTEVAVKVTPTWPIRTGTRRSTACGGLPACAPTSGGI